eukprot:CAMPEP_0195288154 /NCGR_PEP_ID=MMETSP0707-20130614/4930_1 /TAXON_ID=33640 /ORGANISM="Asterionellopsis glacialis, Strain CCMP134" /LENGTH=334 /DNA_ID=CAMNT_0040347979 /DNA_START=52 /DNA_END=1056 /DNA_ORIENTATION=+
MNKLIPTLLAAKINLSTCFSRLRGNRSGIIFEAKVGCRRSFVSRTSVKMSSKHKSEFDAEQANLYNIIAEQHRHQDGPWNMIATEVGISIDDVVGDLKTAKILDLASGPGEPAVTIAKSLRTSGSQQHHVYSTDLSTDMNKVATKASEEVENMSAMVVDMMKLEDHFEPGSMDVVTCCYGFMFPDNKEKALQEAYNILQPGGTLIATTWDNVALLTLLEDIMHDVLGHRAPPPDQNPLSLSEPELFEQMLCDANFSSNLKVIRSTYPFDFGNDPEMQFKLCTLLVKDKLTDLNGWDTAREAFIKYADQYSKVNEQGNRIFSDNTFKMVVAKKAR